ncbi:MAG: cytochrome b N-terminal domain-containing protein [Candidatus Palauibacterales bacterium]|nr:cytochrome b N-terminal domain-containing protein [Candidatus Palauibacterales bacterium]MDP2529040.1 cytochrome b N-terminal domain-containing protein [Candidatus Palauibacterales bacterium]MDP2583859.1 cytochrome b N-terminal domain-containing protein [Candidatus Palauibacterales bacterium]
MMSRDPKAAREWFVRLWADLKASTDASLLVILRFVGLLYGPLDTRLPIGKAFRKALRHRLSPEAGWRQAFGGIAYLLFIILVVTGVLLSFYYRPSTQEAYQSIQHIVSGVSFGWLMRDLHVWAANLVVLGALLHMARVFFGAAYKPPRETNWIVGVLLLFSVFAFGATGYLLPWDQWSYWTVTEGLDILARTPLVGGWLVRILRADPIVSGATLSRFFAIHVIVLPWLVLGLLALHFALVRKHGVAPRVSANRTGRTGVPFFPYHFLRMVITGTLVVAVALTAALLFPRPVAAPANPAQPPGMLFSTWILADVSRALIYYLGGWGFGAFLLLGAGMVLLPIFDRSPERRLRRRPIVAALGVLFFLTFATAWGAGWRLRSIPTTTSGELTPFQKQPTGATPGAPLPSIAPASRPATSGSDTTNSGGAP